MKTRAAFTLTELLVTIAIIAILASLSISALGVVRNSADNARCIANLRASGTAMLQYFTDNNGNFFTGKNWFAYPSTKSGPNNGMREYFGIVAENDKNAVITDEIFQRDSILTCPAMKRKYPQLYPQGLNRGYGINYYLQQKDPNKNYDGLPSSERPLLAGSYQKVTNVPRPSAMWILTETPVNNELLGSLNDNTASYGEKYLSLPHNGKQNAFFLDGHITALTVDDFMNPPNPRYFWGSSKLPEHN